MPSRRVTDLSTLLCDLWLDMRATYTEQFPNRELWLTASYRSPVEQFELYKKGRHLKGQDEQDPASWELDGDPSTQILTYRDGYVKLSKHNLMPSQALDFVILIDGKISWEPKEYTVVGELAEAKGFVWGGSWKSFPDFVHVEVPDA